MTDLSKRLRDAATHRETVTPDEHGLRVLSASFDRAKALMAEAADALDARDATHVDKADAWDAVTAKRSRWQTMESAPRDGTPILVWRNGHPIVRASVWRVRPKMLPDWEIHIIRDGMDPPFEGFPILTRLGDANAPTHWHPLPPPPEDV